ncbi:MAG: hypothetical protein M0020_07485 [Actinomycetota bacterium]|nr:hypothetical protein [Actinomycetota bacterium]
MSVDHAPGPPVGSGEITTSPAPSTAAQKVAEAQATAEIPRGELHGPCVSIRTAGAHARGLVDATAGAG